MIFYVECIIRLVALYILMRFAYALTSYSTHLQVHHQDTRDLTHGGCGRDQIIPHESLVVTFGLATLSATGWPLGLRHSRTAHGSLPHHTLPFHRQDELKGRMLQRPEGSSECILLQSQDTTCHRASVLQGFSVSSQVRRLRGHRSLEHESAGTWVLVHCSKKANGTRAS